MSSGDDISYIVSGGCGSNHIGAANPVFGRAGIGMIKDFAMRKTRNLVIVSSS